MLLGLVRHWRRDCWGGAVATALFTLFCGEALANAPLALSFSGGEAAAAAAAACVCRLLQAGRAAGCSSASCSLASETSLSGKLQRETKSVRNQTKIARWLKMAPSSVMILNGYYFGKSFGTGQHQTRGYQQQHACTEGITAKICTTSARTAQTLLRGMCMRQRDRAKTGDWDVQGGDRAQLPVRVSQLQVLIPSTAQNCSCIPGKQA